MIWKIHCETDVAFLTIFERQTVNSIEIRSAGDFLNFYMDVI